MPRFRLPGLPAVCVMIAVISGCGGQEAAEPTAAEATVTATGTAPAAAARRCRHGRGSAGARDVARNRRRWRCRSLSRLRTHPDHAVVTLDAASGTFELQPLANYFGADSFEYRVSDGHGNFAQARVDVTVQPLPDPPVIDASATAVVLAAGRDAAAAICDCRSRRRPRDPVRLAGRRHTATCEPAGDRAPGAIPRA